MIQKKTKAPVEKPVAIADAPAPSQTKRSRPKRQQIAKSDSVASPDVLESKPFRLMQVTDEQSRLPDGIERFTPNQELARGALPMFEALKVVSKTETCDQSGLWGLLPFDFDERTLMSASEFREVVDASRVKHPEIEWYYCSANPELEALYHNPWRSPEVQYGGFVGLARTFLRASRIGDLMIDTMVHSRLFATGNLVVATPARWHDYLNFVDEALAEARHNLDAKTCRLLFEEKPQPGRLTMLALIVARMPSIYLAKHQEKMRHYKVALPKQEQGLNAHLRILRDLKDRALDQSDYQLARSWSAYRGLYLAHVFGREWILKHINAITPGNK